MKNYHPPQWPDSEHPKQFHLDFEVDDIEAEQSRVLTLGASLHRIPLAPTAMAGASKPTLSATPSAWRLSHFRSRCSEPVKNVEHVGLV